ncbi:MAG TPA: A/G-specific adenine glycosylase [Tenuifilaceae bacterium]|nr:A/G-specific adenine glycosylase [Tenuifilaceae bacterium]HPE17546.1 A/G-specific adenine glycosylase [Tenuifilaceae bacterium]HPJ45790.1 A/G-specific adenine glycosylase [Tenuifilaceae bacterium]HPQ34006.1 A/G-specific adenine glycosylase [Tenuifilaceae bacterium]HRX68165.1 A/G-specific adenine glycosylase [Tenuifilaceae bacterium]
MDFKSFLIAWYNKNKRDLPWRNTTDPYLIWIAEIILQQTRVAQGLGYYLRFTSEFPTVFDLANANEDKVLKVWQGLGYYTRARNLQKAAKRIVKQYKGKLPGSYDELITIEGIGPYSAGAIASFAFKQVVPAIDGNVYRVMARIFGVFSSPHTSKGKKEFFNLVLELMDRRHPDVFNQALLDFGALQCTPLAPKCDDCPFREYCYAYRNNVIDSLPLKPKRNVPRDRYFNYIMMVYGYDTFISKRKGNDIWVSLYEFPLIETNTLINEGEVAMLTEWRTIFRGVNVKVKHVSPPVKHVLSHQTIYARFFIVELNEVPRFVKKNFIQTPKSELDAYSIPTLIDSYLAAEPAAKYFF